MASVLLYNKTLLTLANISLGWLAFKVFLILILISVSIFLLLKFSQKWLNNSITDNNKNIKINGVKMIAPGKTLFIISIKNQNFLIASHEHGINLISELKENLFDKSQNNITKDKSQNNITK